MTVKLTIKGRLPGLNEYSDAERLHRQEAAKLKRNTQDAIGWQIKAQLRGVRFAKPVHMSYLWVEPDRMRDKDNIAFAKKFVQDALVEMGALKNDGWAQIEGFKDDFAVDKNNPRVEVTMTDGGEICGNKAE